ncbi:MAG: hypothetical protein CMG75_00195 [Candidatus Marinimicrobia bacterium]|nr:hypothetical protein [Candidatus Neomarinimicrobiota bacterium]|tara:strand:- start:25227 stop:26570 length:1344 start_codon:yes stop_codon:yes gene_type:complete
MAKKNKGKKKIIIISIIFVVLTTIGGAWYFSSGEEPISVTVEPVSRQIIIHKVTGSGRIEPAKKVELSANISALIMEISVEEGDSIMIGQPLIYLDRTRYEAAAEQVSSRLKSAKANLTKMKAIKEREDKLFEEKLISSQQLESANASLQAAESEVLTSQAALKSAMDDLTKTSLLAPSTGIVLEIKKDEGEMALGSMFSADVLMSLADLEKMEVHVNVNENDVVSVSIGDTSEIEIDAFQDTLFYGIVTEIAHVAQTTGLGTQDQVTNYQVKVRMLEVPDAIRPGMSATANIITDKKKNALAIPIQSLTVRPIRSENLQVKEEKFPRKDSNIEPSIKFQELEELVFILSDKPGGVIRGGNLDGIDSFDKKGKIRDDGKYVHIRPIKVGISSNTHYEVLDGLNDGEEIVIGSYRAISKDLSHNSFVTVEDDEEKRKEESFFKEAFVE